MAEKYLLVMACFPRDASLKPVGQTGKIIVKPLDTLLRVDEGLLVPIELLEHERETEVDRGELHLTLLVDIEDLIKLVITGNDVLQKYRELDT